VSRGWFDWHMRWSVLGRRRRWMTQEDLGAGQCKTVRRDGDYRRPAYIRRPQLTFRRSRSCGRRSVRNSRQNRSSAHASALSMLPAAACFPSTSRLCYTRANTIRRMLTGGSDRETARTTGYLCKVCENVRCVHDTHIIQNAT